MHQLLSLDGTRDPRYVKQYLVCALGKSHLRSDYSRFAL
jgi:hypothetical protein